MGTFGFIVVRNTWLKNAFVKFFMLIHSGVQSVFTSPNISYGLTIILVTIIIRLVLFPLNYKQIRSQVKLNKIQPKIQELQKKYKNNPQKQQEEMMKIYKDEGISPLGGCLPLIIQWPILFALYYVFVNLNTIDPNINNATFLGIRLMGVASSNPVTWILPILSGALTYLSTIIVAPKNGDEAQGKQAKTMGIFMSLFITWMSFRFTSALVLYWVTNSIFQIAQTLVTKNIEDNKSDKKEEYKEVK